MQRCNAMHSPRFTLLYLFFLLAYPLIGRLDVKNHGSSSDEHTTHGLHNIFITNGLYGFLVYCCCIASLQWSTTGLGGKLCNGLPFVLSRVDEVRSYLLQNFVEPFPTLFLIFPSALRKKGDSSTPLFLNHNL